MLIATDEGVRLTRRTALAFIFTSACTTRDPARALIRACRYLWSQQAEDAVGKMDPLLYDYPNYATALSVQSLRRAHQPVGPLIDWLRTQQFTEAHGWKRDDPPYGAWGI